MLLLFPEQSRIFISSFP